MKKNHPWTQQELDGYALEYATNQCKRVKNYRKHGDIGSQSILWDIPRVSVACASKVAPFHGERDRNCSNLRNPHRTLYNSYPSVKKETNPPSYPNEPHYAEGHCAEPHAAHRLLNTMDLCHKPICIADIQFSTAFKVKDGIPIAYCATCKLTFPQLR